MVKSGILSKNYFIDPEEVTELGTNITQVMSETDRAMEEASEIIAKIASLTESVPSHIRCEVLLEMCTSAQAEIKSFDFLSYGFRVDQGLQNLLEENQYFTECFMKKMRANTERMQGLENEFRRLTDSIMYAEEKARPNEMASSIVSNTETANTDDTEEELPTREELLRQAAAKMAGITLNEDGRPNVLSRDEVNRIKDFERYLNDLRRGEYTYVQIAVVLAGVANSNLQPSINDPMSSIKYSNYFSLLEAITYTDSIIEYIKQSESLVLELYNDGQTIAYGFDLESHSNIIINFKPDGTITEEEAERLLCIVLDENAQQLNSFLDKNGYEITQNAYDAAMDLIYNRGFNDYTKEVIIAMIEKNDDEVKDLLEDFDVRFYYGYNINGINTKEEAEEYVENHSGFAVRRKDEYFIYMYGFDSEGGIIYGK